MTIVFMFPGQSSRDPEMFERLVALDAEAASDVMGRASRALGRDLAGHYQSDNLAMFATNRDVQVGVFVANHAHMVALERTGVRAQVSLGLSLGEYNHLVHAGAISFEDAVRLVDARGAAYDAGPRGAMACVFPLPLEELREAVGRMPARGHLEIANLNSPTQNVIAGETQAVAAACEWLEEEQGCSCIVIEDKIPMHASIFRPVVDTFEPALRAARWRTPRLRYLPNVTAAFEDAPTAARIVERLARHVHSPVLWRQSVDLVAGSASDVVFVEVGPRTVLYNLLSRSWRKNPRFATDGQHTGLHALGQEIARAA